MPRLAAHALASLQHLLVSRVRFRQFLSRTERPLIEFLRRVLIAKFDFSPGFHLVILDHAGRVAQEIVQQRNGFFRAAGPDQHPRKKKFRLGNVRRLAQGIHRRRHILFAQTILADVQPAVLNRLNAQGNGQFRVDDLPVAFGCRPSPAHQVSALRPVIQITPILRR